MHIYDKYGVSTSSTIFFYTPGNKIPSFFYYPLCIGHYYCSPPYLTDRNSFDSFLLLYTKNGRGSVEIDGIQTDLLPGDACLIDCYRPHRYHAMEEWEILWLHIDGGNARDIFSSLAQNRPFFHTQLKAPLSFEKIWHQLHELFLDQKPLSSPLLSQHISQLLTNLAMNSDDNGYKTSPDFIDDTLKYINLHLSTDLTLEKLAKRVALSPFYFSRKFKEETGYSPYQYILLSRINLAKFYLKSTKDTVKSIGMQCGFKSEHSFCTAFKKETGFTPSEFRDS